MKFIYPAVFRKTDKGTYRGFFPDLEDCYGEGDTLDEAIEEANAAAYNWITLELDEDDCQLPPVSDEDDLELQDGDIVRNISVNIRFYVMIFPETLPQQISTSLLLLFLSFSEYQYRRCHHSRKYKYSDKYFKWCIVSGLRTGCCFHTA